MKLCNTPYSLEQYFSSGQMDVKGFIEYCARVGFDAVDLGYYWKNEEEELKQALNWLKDNRIKLGSYIVSNHFTRKDEKERRAEIDKVKHAIDCASRIDAPALRIFCGSIGDGFPSYEATKKIIVDCFKEACDYAERKKVMLAFENHGNICATPEQMLDLLKAVNSPNLKFCVDIGNFRNMKLDPVEAVAKLMPYAAMTHIKDNKKEGDKLVSCVVGEGEVNLKECLRVIEESGYKGYNTLEYEGETGDAKVGVEKSLANIRKTLKELGK